MNRRETEARVREIGWPLPTPELRERILAAAVLQDARISWSDRVWFSRGWRLSALLAALVVVGVEQISEASRTGGGIVAPYAAAQAEAVDGAAQQVGLSPVVAAVFASRALAAASSPRTLAQTGQAALQELDPGMTGATR